MQDVENDQEYNHMEDVQEESPGKYTEPKSMESPPKEGSGEPDIQSFM